MDNSYIREQRLNECLNIILRNRLVFPSKEEFAEFAEYPSLLKNNPITKLPYQRKLELLLNIQATFSIEYSGYETIDDLIRGYQDTSTFFRAFLETKKTLSGVNPALCFAKALYIERGLSGGKKADAVLERLYDFEEGKMRNDDVDVDMLLLMMMCALPPVSEREPKVNPDYEKEWETVSEFLERCGQATPNISDSPLIYEAFDQWNSPGFAKSRLHFIVSVAQMSKIMKEASLPEDMYDDNLLPKIEGLWQSYEKGELKGRNVYYEFSRFGRCFSLCINEDYPSVVKYGIYSCVFYQYDENTPVVMIEHPKAGYYFLKDRKGKSDYETFLKFKEDGKKYPEELRFSYFKGARRHELGFSVLKKLEAKDEQHIKESWGKKTRVDKYADYSCVFTYPDCILVLTRKFLLVEDSEWGNGIFKIPMGVDPRLKRLRLDSECAFMKIGKDERAWITFPSIALYINPDQFSELGIEKVDFEDSAL